MEFCCAKLRRYAWLIVGDNPPEFAQSANSILIDTTDEAPVKTGTGEPVAVFLGPVPSEEDHADGAFVPGTGTDVFERDITLPKKADSKGQPDGFLKEFTCFLLDSDGPVNSQSFKHTDGTRITENIHCNGLEPHIAVGKLPGNR
jgi:hypothetical protein